MKRPDLEYSTVHWPPLKVMEGDGDGDGDGGGDGGGGGSDPLAPIMEAMGKVPERLRVMPDGSDQVDPAATIAKLTESYTNIESRFGQKREEYFNEFQEEQKKQRGEVPESADGYKPLEQLPEDVALPEGVSLEDVYADPLVKWWREVAHAQGIGQEQFNSGIVKFIQDANGVAAARREATMKELGENAKARVDGVMAAVAKKVGDAGLKALRPVVTNADAFKALEALVTGSGFGQPGSGDTTTTTKADLQKKMQQPGYWDPTHPDHQRLQKEVAEGFRTMGGGA